ncbi:MAG TPA: DUF3626 domain-containing protein [Terracidiphilus sp.]|nr:DUF3626 domain-containing protein [Terracidiphilus sp.]
MLNLTPYQKAAIEAVQGRAMALRIAAGTEIDAILRRSASDAALLDSALKAMQTGARIGLHFHPERLSRAGVSVAEGLLSSGVYTNQFVAGLSSGSPSAFPGGERDLWERHLFQGTYHTADVTPAGRPKYGALDVMHYPDGPAPRFGSCYFLLRPDVAKRSTFTFGGSHEECALDRTGTLDAMEPVLAPLLSQLERCGGAFNIADMSVERCLTLMAQNFLTPFPEPASRPLGRALDSFIEVQVHGALCIRDDAELLVVDPAFRDHPVGEVLRAISNKYLVPINWHPGYQMPVQEVPDVFREYPVRPLAERIAADGMLDAATIGAAANSVSLEPESWEGWASHDDILAQFRRLWHVLVLGGAPRSDRF